MRAMSRSNIVVAVFAAGLAALGFALGQFVEARREEPGWQPPPPPPKYTVKASFELDDPVTLALALPPTAPEGSLADVLADKNAFRRAAKLGVLLPTLDAEALPELRAALEDTYAAHRVSVLGRRTQLGKRRGVQRG